MQFAVVRVFKNPTDASLWAAKIKKTPGFSVVISGPTESVTLRTPDGGPPEIRIDDLGVLDTLYTVLATNGPMLPLP